MIKNIISVLGGAVGAQLVALLAAPVITRVFTPDDFGSMTTVWAVVGVAGIVACLAYEKTIVLERNEISARQILVLCVYISIITSVSVSFLIYLFGRYVFPEYFGVAYASAFVLFGVCLFGVRKALDFYATRHKEFKLVAVTMLAGAIAGAVWKITVGTVWNASAEVLLLGNILGIGLPAIMLYMSLSKSIGKPFVGQPGHRIDVLKKHSDFPKKQVPNALLNAFQQQAPIFILAAYFGSEMVGFYGLAMAVLLRPVRALAEAVSRVYLQRISAMDTEDFRADLLRITVRLAVIAMPFCVILFIYGEVLFKLLFGDNWGEAGYMASLMAPWVLMLVVNVPTTQALIVRRALGFILVFNTIYLVVRVIGLVGTIYITGDVYSAILAFSLIGFFANLIYIGKGIMVARNG